MSTVEFRNFSWRHAGRLRQAVTDIDLRIDHGERVLLLGASGAGKSTLLTAMAGLLAEDSGEQTGQVLVDGKDPRQARGNTGIVFQDPQSQLVMARCGDDVAFGLENRAVPAQEIWPKVDKALSTVGFGYEMDRQVNALSGGEQQRLVLAGALATEPTLLLLDEPTANLDPDGAMLMRQSLNQSLHNRDTTLVLIEHRVSDALELVDRVIVLTPDGITADGTPTDIFGKHNQWLSAHGIWVPGAPTAPRPRTTSVGDPIITANGVGLQHPDSPSPALNPLEFTMHQSELTAIVGPNGSGKSTLALLLGGLAQPSVGGVFAAKPRTRRFTKPLHQWRAAALSAHIGSVFQDPKQQFVTSKVVEELTLRPKSCAPISHTRRDELLERLRLTHLAHANPFTLSGGEARRLSVATVLSRTPEAVILDEPTFGQDRTTWLELVDLITDLRETGMGVIAVTHDMDFASAVADRTVELRGGSLC